ncbi:MAG: hypothetical protein PHU68_07320 [Paludibacter sp.]|nr:hypothetical protein [Paludibacter sp.]
MKLFSYKTLALLLAVSGMISLTSCESSVDEDIDGNSGDKAYYHVVMAIGEGGDDGTLTQAIPDLTKGTITFNGYGFEVPSTRTARVYASNDGKYLYNLNYGGGTVAKFSTAGGQSYTKINETNVQYAIGTTHPRWTKVNDETALLHNVITEHSYSDAEATVYDYTKATAYLVSVDLENKMTMGAVERFEIPLNAEDLEKKTHVWRIDAPVVSNGKAFYGVAKRTYNATTGTNVNVPYSSMSIVVDYPSLTNPSVITSTVAKGSTYGYRTPVAHVDEKGAIYQVAGSPSYILKIAGNDYDNSFVFDLSEKLGLGIQVASNGWFYTGNGIGYVPFYDIAKGNSATAAAWGVARVDLYNGTAVKMNIPGQLWLQQYQYSVKGKDGKFYMALAPVGEEGYIYMFDPASPSPDAFTTGAKLESAAGQFYIGIF